MTTILCRCEDITEEDIIMAIEEGYRSLEDLKRKLRLGMGPCQGRTCIPLAMRLLEKKTGIPREKMTIPCSHPPIVPVSLGTLAGEKHEK